MTTQREKIYTKDGRIAPSFFPRPNKTENPAGFGGPTGRSVFSLCCVLLQGTRIINSPARRWPQARK